jgi:hypothetical protein
MPGRIATTLLWLFIINLGIALGAGLYEGRIVIPHWITWSPDSGMHWNAEAAHQDDTGLRFWALRHDGPSYAHHGREPVRGVEGLWPAPLLVAHRSRGGYVRPSPYLWVFHSDDGGTDAAS